MQPVERVGVDRVDLAPLDHGQHAGILGAARDLRLIPGAAGIGEEQEVPVVAVTVGELADGGLLGGKADLPIAAPLGPG